MELMMSVVIYILGLDDKPTIIAQINICVFLA